MAFYFDKNTNVESKEVTTRAEIDGKLYTFKTDNNVFSKKGLDFGTRTLLESIDIKNISGDVLDFGCGYGPIGIIIKSNTDANVDMIDINNAIIPYANTLFFLFNTLLPPFQLNLIKLAKIYKQLSRRIFLLTGRIW